VSGALQILVLEDDPAMRSLLERGLVAEGYDVTPFESGLDALIAVRDSEFDGAVVDVMLPGMSGFEFCRHVRDAGESFPILLLTARDAVKDRVFGLDSGADDYLTKPFDFSELSARLRAMMRRRSGSDKLRVSVGQLVLDSETLRITQGDKTIPASPKEFALLRLLATEGGEPVNRQRILEQVWGSAEHIDPNIIDQYISYLRRKLEPGASGVRIVTVRGAGYRLEVD
jgi:two-component system OmpR family response regulator